MTLSRTIPHAPADWLRRRALLRFLDERFRDRLTLERMARAIDRGRSFVALAVKEETGVTPHRYLVKRRIDYAAELLRTGEKVEAAMAEAGFRSKRCFYRQFKLAMGETPAVWRDRLAKEEKVGQ
jgi:methylphosphotriester-DNA--protein-cysteine methyltransferase